MSLFFKNQPNIKREQHNVMVPFATFPTSQYAIKERERGREKGVLERQYDLVQMTIHAKYLEIRNLFSINRLRLT